MSNNNISRIVRLNKGYLYIPKEFLKKIGLSSNASVIIRANENGVTIFKVNALQELETSFQEFDDEFKNLFIKQKAKEIKY